MKEYLQQSRDQILESPRFKEFYLPTLFDFIDDEDLHIQLDAIEVMALIMDQLDIEDVEKWFVPSALQFLDTEN